MQPMLAPIQTLLELNLCPPLTIFLAPHQPLSSMDLLALTVMAPLLFLTSQVANVPNALQTQHLTILLTLVSLIGPMVLTPLEPTEPLVLKTLHLQVLAQQKLHSSTISLASTVLLQIRCSTPQVSNAQTAQMVFILKMMQIADTSMQQTQLPTLTLFLPTTLKIQTTMFALFKLHTLMVPDVLAAIVHLSHISIKPVANVQTVLMELFSILAVEDVRI